MLELFDLVSELLSRLVDFSLPVVAILLESRLLLALLEQELLDGLDVLLGLFDLGLYEVLLLVLVTGFTEDVFLNGAELLFDAFALALELFLGLLYTDALEV